MKKTKEIFFFLTACTIIACSHPGKEFVGTWTGEEIGYGRYISITIKNKGVDFIVKTGDNEGIMNYNSEEKKLTMNKDGDKVEILYSQEKDQLTLIDETRVVGILDRVK